MEFEIFSLCLHYCVKTYVSDGQDDGRVVYFVQGCERNSNDLFYFLESC